ncbi:hypothetical protein O6P43_021835 [Quillaja saponaria]|uniref:Uncharacterized protein n=1 Tax=Quillaja saponaria TaxID=32244 RepID=A0AAD7LBR0_QUISA|nr:hypothetical protein O6P43_021835 [Quillaja saponaria]
MKKSSDGSNKTSSRHIHTEIVEYIHGKGTALFRVEGKGINSSTETVSIKHEYGTGDVHGTKFKGLSIEMKVQNSKDNGLRVQMNTEANFVLVPKKKQRYVTRSGRISEIQSESYSYGGEQGVFTVEKTNRGGCVRMLKITHKCF